MGSSSFSWARWWGCSRCNIGLIVSDLAVALIWLSGRLGAGRVPGGQLALGLISGIGSLGVGATFILETSFLLASLVGG
jgi:hypothetical protein